MSSNSSHRKEIITSDFVNELYALVLGIGVASVLYTGSSGVPIWKKM